MAKLGMIMVVLGAFLLNSISAEAGADPVPEPAGSTTAKPAGTITTLKPMMRPAVPARPFRFVRADSDDQLQVGADSDIDNNFEAEVSGPMEVEGPAATKWWKYYYGYPNYVPRPYWYRPYYYYRW